MFSYSFPLTERTDAVKLLISGTFETMGKYERHLMSQASPGHSCHTYCYSLLSESAIPASCCPPLVHPTHISKHSIPKRHLAFASCLNGHNSLPKYNFEDFISANCQIQSVAIQGFTFNFVFVSLLLYVAE